MEDSAARGARFLLGNNHRLLRLEEGRPLCNFRIGLLLAARFLLLPLLPRRRFEEDEDGGGGGGGGPLESSIANGNCIDHRLSSLAKPVMEIGFLPLRLFYPPSFASHLPSTHQRLPRHRNHHTYPAATPIALGEDREGGRGGSRYAFSIGGRGVDSWEGGSDKFWRGEGGRGFWIPRGGTNLTFLRGERGGN